MEEIWRSDISKRQKTNFSEWEKFNTNRRGIVHSRSVVNFSSLCQAWLMLFWFYQIFLCRSKKIFFSMSHNHQKKAEMLHKWTIIISLSTDTHFMTFCEKNFVKFPKVVRHNSSTAGVFWNFLLKIKNSTRVMPEYDIL